MEVVTCLGFSDYCRNTESCDKRRSKKFQHLHAQLLLKKVRPVVIGIVNPDARLTAYPDLFVARETAGYAHSFCTGFFTLFRRQRPSVFPDRLVRYRVSKLIDLIDFVLSLCILTPILLKDFFENLVLLSPLFDLS